MCKSENYLNKCGSCANYERMYKNGQIQEHGRCSIRGNYHNSSQKGCKKYNREREFIND